MRKEPIFSIKLPVEERYGENKKWEDSHECYELDTEFLNLYDFTSKSRRELIGLIRHCDNFLSERGISDWFMRNYALIDQAFRQKND